MEHGLKGLSSFPALNSIFFFNPLHFLLFSRCQDDLEPRQVCSLPPKPLPII
uniref:Uncharacterized protein n=1 Tax=Rhizophora mucronata TaxID=61149 RepID=A0A2P2PMW6_RHIMU